MKIGAIISEFNPFHNGHKYIIEKAKLNTCSHVIAIMSGNYVQRGEPSVFSKKYRTEVALKNGVDLVVEMPCTWSVSRAERYAEAGVWLAEALGCVDFLIFGSECGDLSQLIQVEKLLGAQEIHEFLHRYLDKGCTFAKARESAILDLVSEESISHLLSTPNNVLGIEYIKAINKFSSSLTPVTFMRDSGLKSASEIRELIKNEDSTYFDYVPQNACGGSEIVRDLFWGEKGIIAVLKTLKLDVFRGLPDISEGLENKIYNSLKECNNLNNLFELIKSKRYTMSRIKRIILCAYLGITDKIQKRLPPYIRVLGATKKGLEILKLASKTATLPIVSKYSEVEDLDDFSKNVFEIECRATDLLCVFSKKMEFVESEKKFKFIRQELA